MTADKVDSVVSRIPVRFDRCGGFLRILVVNLLISDHWGPLSQRAITVLAAPVFLRLYVAEEGHFKHIPGMDTDYLLLGGVLCCITCLV